MVDGGVTMSSPECAAASSRLSDEDGATTGGSFASDDLLALASIRHGLHSQLAGEPLSAMARTICDFSIAALDRIIARHALWPGILAESLPAQADSLAAAVDLLDRNGAGDGDCRVAPGMPGHLTAPADNRLESLEAGQNRLNALLEELAAPLMRAHASGQLEAADVFRSLAAAFSNARSMVSAASKSRVDAYAARAECAVRVTRETVERYLRERFPERRELSVTGFDELPGGSSKATFLVDICALEGDGVTSVVMRMDRHGGSTDKRVIDEAAVLQAAYRLGLPVAELLWTEADPAALGSPFIVTRKVVGTPAGGMMGAVARQVGADVGRDVARLLARLHSLDPTEFGLRQGSGEHPMRALIDNARQLWRASKREPDGLLECCLCWLEENLPPMPARLSLIHGDVGAHNLLIADGRVAAILDWELFHPGDPMEELAYSRTSIEMMMPWDEFLAEYERHGGAVYSEQVENYYRVWVAVRNAIYTLRCRAAFYSGENPDIRWAGYGDYYHALMSKALTRIGQVA